MTHSLSAVHPNAKIAANVCIEPFAFIEEDVEIGEGTWIGPHAVIMNGARIGKNCKIFPGAVIAGIPQDLKFIGEKTTAVIGDNTVIRECCTINRGTVANLETRIGSDCLIMAYAHVGHDCIVGNHCILANSVSLAGHVIVEDWAIINAVSGVQQFLTVGAHTYLSATAFVRKNVPPFIKAAKEPLAYAGINVVGLQRRGFSEESIERIHETYRILYQQGLNTTQACEKIRESIPASPEREQILAFIENSTNGIIKGMR